MAKPTGAARRRQGWRAAICAMLFASQSALARHDHGFEAMLQAPFRAERDGGRTLRLYFTAPDDGAAHRLRWRLALLSRKGDVLKQWQGTRALGAGPAASAAEKADVAAVVDGSADDGAAAGQAAAGALEVALRWRAVADAKLPAGIYRLRLRAWLDGDPAAEQLWEVAVGTPRAPAPGLPSGARPLAALRAAPSSPVSPSSPSLAPSMTPPPPPPPYRIYLGNLHSQSGHSDGGGELGHCTGAQRPQSAAAGPDEAYAYAHAHGLDFLMTSEHNHMYDGSEGTNPDADALAARALYQSGLRDAAGYTAAHPDFLALYGQEWGVISHGGHLNILNAPELLGWERNAANELLADTETPKGDYAGLYTLMRERGWLGQFNHPQGDQFAAAGAPLGWTTDGDATMALCEVMNSNAYSNREDEGEPRRGNYGATCDKLLEAGYHVAFSSNQDNHCANWGASYSNRTAVLLPAGAPFTADTLLEALRARRVYATMDKAAQLILTANGHMMGERFDNRGPLRLQAGYASANGRRASTVTIFQGVPGRHGAVSELGRQADTVFTPAPGQHFYYARVTQDDGKMLWSAPVWVDQRP